MLLLEKLTRAAMIRSGNSRTSRSSCDCLKGCREVSFQSIDFYTDFIYTGKRNPPWAGSSKLGPNQVTKVAVYSRTNQCLGKHRSIRYTFLKFAGICGGLLSLLMGFSVISAIEIVYAFVLRPLSRNVHEYLGQLLVKAPKHMIAVRPADQPTGLWNGPVNPLDTSGRYVNSRQLY